IVDQRSSAKGILSVEGGKFAQALESEAGDWIAAGEAPILMSGMIGSRQGWAEAAYAECPAGFAEIARALKEVRWGSNRAWIAPGLSCRDEAGVRDVMRGEEAQILGVMDELGAGESWICLPGTHSKWVQVRDGRIERFWTHMTGEVFAVLRNHSILGRMMIGEETDEAAFLVGVARAAQPGGLLHHLFGVRSRGLFGEIAEGSAASYLSGILIGHELQSAGRNGSRFHVLCAAPLAALYSSAARAIGSEAVALDPAAAVRGLFKLSKTVTT
ncbi:MAG: 2-dehydro-3-deoxygalactonokinase, partial [Candidatus Binatia bacterium]